MRTLGNIIWFLFVGFWTGLVCFFLGLFWCISIIGIPFGKQSFKIARLIFSPFGTTIKTDFGNHPIANVIWLLLGGLELAFVFVIVGLILCITVVGIPFGKQCFKLAELSAIPFGASF